MSKKKNNKALSAKECLEIPIQTTIPNESVKIEFDENGQIFIRQSREPIKITRSRQRQSESKKPKLISTLSLGQLRGYTTIWETIKRQYDRVVAIDSGRFKYGKYDLCIVSSCYSEKTINISDKEIECKYFDSYLFQTNSVHEEIIGWHILFNYILPNSDIKMAEKICLVTDHQEMLHKKLNERKAPYYLNQMIPDNIGIVYASDSGDHGLNIAIKACHNKCRKVMKQVNESKVIFPIIEHVDSGGYHIVAKNKHIEI